MRFEIGAGGVFLILLGLAGLSGSVFILGMFAGYEVARQEQPSQGMALVYPAPSSPSASETASPPETSSSPSAAATSTPTAAALRSAPLPPVIAGPSQPAVSSVAPGTQISAPAGAERSPGASHPQAVATSAVKLSAAKPAEKGNARSTSSTVHVGPYSVEIQAVMDGQAALEMVNKLRHIGYQAYAVEVEIEGQKWYKVRVGHFASRAEALSAEGRLHEQFSGSLTTR